MCKHAAATAFESYLKQIIALKMLCRHLWTEVLQFVVVISLVANIWLNGKQLYEGAMSSKDLNGKARPNAR